MKRHILIGIVLLGVITNLKLVAQNQTLFYTADTTSIFPNPERGWYFSYTPYCCDKTVTSGCNETPVLINGPHDPLIKVDLQKLRSLPEAVTIIRDVVKIQQWSGDIPRARLDQIQADLNTVRQAGLKVAWRISYNYGMDLGEPCASLISRHLDQLRPIIQNNADVIFDIQLGMFGGSGEGCCNSFLIDDPGNNNEWSSLKTDAIALYNKLISFVPADRSVAIRYPRYKYQMMGWINSDVQAHSAFPAAAVPLGEQKAFDGSLQARLGFYQDNFAGDSVGYGFFNAWGQKDRDFTAADSRYSLMEGELSADTKYNEQMAAAEMEMFHFTAFHGLGNNNFDPDGYDGWQGASDAWKKSGQYDVIGKKLGYRFQLISAAFPISLSQDSLFRMNLKIANDGWARIMNPRKVEIVFRNKSSGNKYVIEIDGDGRGNRLWLPGPGETKTLNISKPLPKEIPVGEYDLFLNLPDPYPSIHHRPEYSIRLANQNMWEEKTGFNLLLKGLKLEGPNKKKNN